MKIHMTALAAAAGLALLAGPAFAQLSSSIAPNGAFEDVDTDDNALVSWTEFQAVFSDITEEQFNLADSDGDGSLNAEEYDALMVDTASVGSDTSDRVPIPSDPSIPQDLD